MSPHVTTGARRPTSLQSHWPQTFWSGSDQERALTIAKGLNAERRRERLLYVQRIYKLNTQLRRMQAAAALTIAGSRHTASKIPKQFRCKLFLLSGNAIDPTRFTLVAPKDTTLPPRACFVSRLMPYKRPHILLNAISPFARSGQLVLGIIGERTIRPELTSQADSLWRRLQGDVARPPSQ